ncbi:MAG: hypothetical protein ACM3SX_21820 [Deltaproteobacteria bacterium]
MSCTRAPLGRPDGILVGHAVPITRERAAGRDDLLRAQRQRIATVAIVRATIGLLVAAVLKMPFVP